VVAGAVVLATVALVLAGCGGSSPSVAPAKYVRSICSALGVWKAQVQNAGKKLQSSGASSASPPAAKTDYVQFVSALRSATQGAASALKQAGSQARAIPTTNATVFEAAASAVTTQIRNSLQGIASITPRNSAQLRTAASREPSCQVLSSA
jgi:hypothetical protein